MQYFGGRSASRRSPEDLLLGQLALHLQPRPLRCGRRSRPKGFARGPPGMAIEDVPFKRAVRAGMPPHVEQSLFHRAPVIAVDPAPGAAKAVFLFACQLLAKTSIALETAFAAARGTSDAVVFQASLPTKRVAELALANRLPAGTSIRAFAEIGGLMSYGSHGPWLFRQAAKFVHKILLGQKPTDIPLEQATKFELVINLKTAREIGLTVPGPMLARADDVIE